MEEKADEASFLLGTPSKSESEEKKKGNERKIYNKWYLGKIVGIVTFDRLRTLIIVLLMLFCLFIFTSTDEGNLVEHLYSTSPADPSIIYPELPFQVIWLKITVQSVSDSIWSNYSLVSTFQVSNDVEANDWIDVDSMVLLISDYTPNSTTGLFYTDSDVTGGISPVFRFLFETDCPQPVGMSVSLQRRSKLTAYQESIALLILLGVYVLIVFELVHRTIAAMLGAFVAVAAVSAIQARPTLPEVIEWIDFETVGLLFGMMVMVGIFSTTGFFEWIAFRALKLAKGQSWRLVMILCLMTAVLSAFLDNVTTILLLTPVTIKICEAMNIPPQQILIALVMFSNIGGASTPVGDPPNIIIVNDPNVQQYDVSNFFTFTLHMTPAVLLAGISVYFLLKRLCRHALTHQDPHMKQKREINIWNKTLGKMRADSEEELQVKQKLADYVEVLKDELQISIQKTQSKGDLKSLEKSAAIKDTSLLINSAIVLGVVVCLFFLHGAINMSLAWIAIIGAMFHLVSGGIRDVEEVLEKVEFSTLVFFAGLFVLMEALALLGLISLIGTQTAALIAMIPEGFWRLLIATILILWISAFVSAFIDNIPYTAAMVPVVVGLGSEGSGLGLPLSPLIYALALGTCLGGNGTLIGASANVVAAGLSEQQGFPITFNFFFRTGFPVMLVSIVTSTLYLIVFQVIIPWY